MYRPDPGFVGEDSLTYDLPVDPTAFIRLGPPPGAVDGVGDCALINKALTALPASEKRGEGSA
jgi:hypothetical protein